MELLLYIYLVVNITCTVQHIFVFSTIVYCTINNRTISSYGSLNQMSLS